MCGGEEEGRLRDGATPPCTRRDAPRHLEPPRAINIKHQLQPGRNFGGRSAGFARDLKEKNKVKICRARPFAQRCVGGFAMFEGLACRLLSPPLLEACASVRFERHWRH